MARRQQGLQGEIGMSKKNSLIDTEELLLKQFNPLGQG